MTTKCKLYVGLVAFVLGILLGSFSYAQEAAPERPVGNLNVSLYSQYIWRGFELSKNSAVFFPSLTVGYKGFACNVWVDFDTDYNNPPPGENSTKQLWETDWVLTYSNKISKLNWTFGWIYYDTKAGDAQELYLILGLDWPLLMPTFSVWREIQNGPAWYMNFALSHSFKLGSDWSLDVGTWVSYWDNQTADYRAFHDGNVWAGLKIPLNEFISVTPKVQYSFPMSAAADRYIRSLSFNGEDKQFVYGGLILDITF